MAVTIVSACLDIERFVIGVGRGTTTGEHRGSLCASMRVRRCLVNRTKCGGDPLAGGFDRRAESSCGLSARPYAHCRHGHIDGKSDCSVDSNV